jgi:hypothetical protein
MPAPPPQMWPDRHEDGKPKQRQVIKDGGGLATPAQGSRQRCGVDDSRGGSTAASVNNHPSVDNSGAGLITASAGQQSPVSTPIPVLTTAARG